MGGLGIGLILGALLLYVMNFAAKAPAPSQPPKAPAASELDMQALKQQAGLYYQVFGKDEKVYTEPQVDDLLKRETGKPADAKKIGADSTKVVYIEDGYKAASVSDMLFKAGIITDRKAFEDELSRQQKTGKIQVGAHVFTAPLDMNGVIAKKITALPAPR